MDHSKYKRLSRLHRATWVSTELLLTFTPPTLKGVHLVPLNDEETAGRFRVWLSTESGPCLIWDRKVEGGFPELKVLVSVLYALGICRFTPEVFLRNNAFETK